MGRFVNPGNTSFERAIKSEIYIDKSGLLKYTNKVMDTNQGFICNSRPRRFGKSVTADMLTAYYSRGCDSAGLFSGLEISEAASFHEHLNKYDVIHLDIQWCMELAGTSDNVLKYITNSVRDELRVYYPDSVAGDETSLSDILSKINVSTGNRFVVIIDEWDVLIRDEASNQKIQDEYISFLRGLFKGSGPSAYMHLAYLTGILPIKKTKTQSALNNFDEFTMTNPAVMDKYIGFTDDEVRLLCRKYDKNYEQVRHWYNGYRLNQYHVYNPKAVVSLMMYGSFKSYWSATGTYDIVVPLINMDFDGLKTSIIEMLSGSSVAVDVSSFQNDTVNFANKDDVLTYMIHLGYLGYDESSGTAFVPNEELRQELVKAVNRKKWNEMYSFMQASEELLEATLDLKSDVVAEKIEKIHSSYASGITYNNENSLSSVISIAYLSSMSYYYRPIRELPAGRGFADYVYIPKMEYADDYPALVVELKWNMSAATAINQIKERKYPDAVSGYTGNILLVGINYDKKTKQHECSIEQYKLEK